MAFFKLSENQVIGVGDLVGIGEYLSTVLLRRCHDSTTKDVNILWLVVQEQSMVVFISVILCLITRCEITHLQTAMYVVANEGATVIHLPLDVK